ncbi:MAG: RluA family pseudouridine synthase [Candidatus Omnitrophica bacterium]|nr:RluA family pseudouridine synthase [Candidatus Omnitrophota bacterium]MCK5179155.1 RluA family pseudouridine synthase [Candidatus Omnitrophota bacterium]
MTTHALKVDEAHDHLRLDVFLTRVLCDVPSRTFVQKLIDFGHVRVNESAVKSHHKVATGDDVHVDIPEDFLTPRYIEPEDIPLDIFYEDDHLIVVNKPRGMVVHPAQGCYTGTLVNALLHHSVKLSRINAETRPGIVHRLDKETSGLLLVAKDNITHTKLAKQFQRHQIKKRYMALVEGEIEFDEGVVDVPIGRHPRHREKKAVQFDDSAKDSKTFYRVIKRIKGVTLVALFPKTGRTHQLRVHMAYLRHPILGDDKYGKAKSFPRLALHAQSIGFCHPQTKKYLELSSRPPREFLSMVGL